MIVKKKQKAGTKAMRRMVVAVLAFAIVFVSMFRQKNGYRQDTKRGIFCGETGRNPCGTGGGKSRMESNRK